MGPQNSELFRKYSAEYNKDVDNSYGKNYSQ